MIPMTLPDWFPREVTDWVHLLLTQGMHPVAIIAVDEPFEVGRIGMAGTPDMTAEQLVTLLEECLTHARRRVQIEHERARFNSQEDK